MTSRRLVGPLLAAVLIACTTRPIDVPATDGQRDRAPSASTTSSPESKPPPPGPALAHPCGGGDASFVRHAFEAVLGRRAHSTREALAYEALQQQVEALDPGRGRRAVVDALTRDPGYIARWVEVYADALYVQRSGPLANAACFESSLREEPRSAAAHVLAASPTTSDPKGPFTMRDVLTGALGLDDVTPIYLANLFPMLARSFSGANAAELSLEHARRADFGGRFDAAYLHRDGVCLRCHNSEASVTFRDDPAQNRHFPLPGRLEAALFGSSVGPGDDGTHDGVARMHAVLRYNGVVGGSESPWGISSGCGTFRAEAEIQDDFAGVDARFASIAGRRASVWGLERSLRRGFQRLRAHGLVRGPDGLVPDSDEAFAYLVSANIVERMWEEIIGTRLTIATSFPRNEAARNQLLGLTESFIASGFSHRELLQGIAASAAFDVPAVAASCLPSSYPYPALFDPWVTAETDPGRRNNGPGDAVAPRSSRTLLRATYEALEWTLPPSAAFPVDESSFGRLQAEIGVPLRSTVPGFRGFDFGARLAWEQHVGACERRGETPDWVDRTIDHAALSPPASGQPARVRDVLLLLKDRLLGEPTLSPREADLAAALVEVPLDTAVAALDATQRVALRRFCGVLLTSPQYLLMGLPSAPVSSPPSLTLPDDAPDTRCEEVAARAPPAYAVHCAAGVLSVTRP